MSILAQLQYENYHIVLTYQSDFDEDGYYAQYELSIRKSELGRWGYSWRAKKHLRFDREYATGMNDSEKPIRDSAFLKFRLLANELLLTGELDVENAFQSMKGTVVTVV